MPEPTATPAAAPAPTATPEKPATSEESVTLTKAEVDQLRRDAARAGEAQARADRLEKLQKRSKTHFSPSPKATPPSQEELEAIARSEDAKAERGLLRLAADPTYREILDEDPTLRDLLTNNPAALLPIYANDAVDAEDAIDMVKEAFAAKVAARKAKVNTENTPAPKTPPTPPTGALNPQGDPGHSAEYEAARKLPNTESAIAGMFKAKANERGLKK